MTASAVCECFKSHGERCEEPSALQYLWPGAQEPLSACIDHARGAAFIADVMGFKLPLSDVVPALARDALLRLEAAPCP